MNRRRLFLLLIAIIAAVGTAGLARKFIQSPSATARVSKETIVQEPSTMVLVAASDLPAGTIIDKGDIKFQAWPQDGILEGFVLKAEGIEQPFIGAVVRRGVVKGEPVTDNRVVKPGEKGFLAAIVEPGHRAISVPVNATTGVSGLFFPGDRVDVILSHAIAAGDVSRNVSETILTDVRVLAVDQRVEDIDGKPAVAKTATLEVSPKQAEVIAMLSTMGKLSLSLRSVGADDAGDLDLAGEHVRAESYTIDSDVSAVIGGLGPVVGEDEDKRTVDVIRGGKKQNTETKTFAISPDGTISVSTGDGEAAGDTGTEELQKSVQQSSSSASAGVKSAKDSALKGLPGSTSEGEAGGE